MFPRTTNGRSGPLAWALFAVCAAGLSAQGPDRAERTLFAAEFSSASAAGRALRFGDAPASSKLGARVHKAAQASAALAFDGRASYVDFGPDPRLGIASSQSFAIAVRLRMSESRKFTTVLMCREGDQVNYSLVVGRRSGRVSFEIWSWQRERATSRTRIDDGRWHDVRAIYDAQARAIAIVVDDVVEGVQRVRESFVPTTKPALRLGANFPPSQHWRGELAQVRVFVPPARGGVFDAREATRCYPPGQAEAAMLSWLENARAPIVPRPADARTWKAAVASQRARVQDALGLWPVPGSGEALAGRPSPLSGAAPRPTRFRELDGQLPLTLRWGGELAREGYTVTRCYWQVVPGAFASGDLYRPKGHADLERPAVLCPHGHFRNGARSEVVQKRCITFAKRGYVVLAVDSVHFDDDPIGLSSAGLMTWNNLRGLELLRSLPGVDAERIGCTGASGGAQQTIYLSAIDAGLAAVAPVAMLCHFDAILSPLHVHCRCNFVPRVLSFVDPVGMAAGFAPRPQLVLSVTQDWTRRFHARAFPSIQAVYAGLGCADAVESRVFEKPHGYDRDMRRAVYAFFDLHIRGMDASAPRAVDESEGLRVEAVSRLAALDRRDCPRNLDAVRREFRTRLAAPPISVVAAKLRDGGAVERRRAHLRRLFEKRPAKEPAVLREVGAFRWRAHPCRRLLLERAGEPAIPLVVFDEGRLADAPLALLLGDGGKASILARRSALLHALLERELRVAVVDVRYTGELDVAARWRDAYGKLLGADEGVLAVRDLRDAVRALRGSCRDVRVCGFGTRGVVALYAAAIDDRITRLVLPALGPSYEARDRRPKIVRVLRHGDLPDALCLFAPRSCVVGGVAEESIATARARYEVFGRRDALTPQPSRLTRDEILEALSR